MNATAIYPHPLIGLVGRAGSGKDTAADYLRIQHGYWPIAFAEPLRCMLRELLHHAGASDDYLHLPWLKQRPIPGLGLSYRQLMTTLGTEWGRGLDPDLWVRLLDAHVAPFARTPIVITDVRFPNEAAYVRARGGLLVRLHRMEAGTASLHESESHVDNLDCHFDIDNSGPLDALHRALDDTLAFAAKVAGQENAA